MFCSQNRCVKIQNVWPKETEVMSTKTHICDSFINLLRGLVLRYSFKHLMALCLPSFQHFTLIWFPIFWLVPDEGYSTNAPCALN